MTIRFATLCAASGILLAAPLRAQEGPAFTVGDIRVEGLQRVTEGTVYNYLPINIGDNLSTQRIREAVRALYDTGFFRDVELRRDGSTLIVVVNERPTIESFELKGNKDIKTEDLGKSLRNVGLAQGKTFDRSVLEDVKSFLQDQYGARGKYAARIDAQVEEVAGNRVKIKIDIVEGKRAKIRQINIVGNETFTEKDILEAFELKTPNLLSFYKQDDRYSRESLQGDLEKLRSFYMDRGYANFEVESTQVAIAPEKDDIFITVNVSEGEVHKIKEVKLAGTFVVPEPLLRRYLLVQPGDTFSRKTITTTQELLQNRLGEDGFAFAKVDPVPTTIGDPANKELSLTFFVDPGNRVYVRHIAFNGVDQDQRRSASPRDAPARGRLAVERRARPFEAASRTPAVHQEGRVRDQAGGRFHRPGRRHLRNRRGSFRAARRWYRLFGVAVVHPQRQLRRCEFPRHRTPCVDRPQFRQVQQGVRRLDDRALLHGRRRGPDRQRHLSRPDSVRVFIFRLLVGDDRRRFRHRISDRRKPGPSHGPAVPEVEPAHERRQQRAPGHRMGGARTAIPTRSASTTTPGSRPAMFAS